MKKIILVNSIMERALSQLDKLGYELAKFGVTDQVNRHTAIGFAITQKTRIESEIERAKLRFALTKSEVNKLSDKFDQGFDQVIEKLPKRIAKRAKRAHKKIRHLKSC